jgi:hypothetical protein
MATLAAKFQLKTWAHQALVVAGSLLESSVCVMWP